MQITTLRQMTTEDRKAALIRLEDSELDRVAADVQGWRIHENGFQDFTWVEREDPRQHFTLDEYHPANDLTQAFELLAECRKRLTCRWTFQAEIFDYDTWHVGLFDRSSTSEIKLMAREGKLAFIVTCLAVLGMIEVGG